MCVRVYVAREVIANKVATGIGAGGQKERPGQAQKRGLEGASNAEGKQSRNFFVARGPDRKAPGTFLGDHNLVFRCPRRDSEQINQSESSIAFNPDKKGISPHLLAPPVRRAFLNQIKTFKVGKPPITHKRPLQLMDS